MAHRDLAPTNAWDRLARQMREFEDRLRAQENGAAIRGRASFGDAVIIGGTDGVELRVHRTGGDSKTLVVTNLATGSTYTINLP